jgi:membrane protein
MNSDRSQPRIIRSSATPRHERARFAPGEERPSPWKLGGLSLVELAKRVGRSANDDDVFGRSAQLGYYFFLALFPALIFLTALIGLLAATGTELHQSLLSYMQTAMPASAYDLVNKVFEKTAQASGAGKLSFGLLASLWSATSGMTALEDTLNAVYNVREERPIWKTYGLAIVLTVVCSILVILALLVILYGNMLANFVSAHLGLGPVATWTWKIVQWPIAFGFLSLVFSLIYYYCPDVDQRHWEWLTPGAVAGIILWAAASFGFRVYLHFFNSYNATYGAFGAVMVLLIWFYVTGMMLLMGAEVNAEIENAAAKRGVPDAKHKGQKTPPAPTEKSA